MSDDLIFIKNAFVGIDYIMNYALMEHISARK